MRLARRAASKIRIHEDTGPGVINAGARQKAEKIVGAESNLELHSLELSSETRPENPGPHVMPALRPARQRSKGGGENRSLPYQIAAYPRIGRFAAAI